MMLTHLCFWIFIIDVWNSRKRWERCYFVSRGLCMWRHEQGQYVWQKCILRHEPPRFVPFTGKERTNMTAPLEVQIRCKKCTSVAWTLLKCLWKYLNIFSFFPFNASRPGSWLLSFISCGNRIPFNVSRPGSWVLILSFISCGNCIPFNVSRPGSWFFPSFPVAIVSPLMYPVLGAGSFPSFPVAMVSPLMYPVLAAGFFSSFPVAVGSSVCRVRTVLVTVQMGIKP